MSSSDSGRWMQSRNRHIRIGPKYQAELPDLVPSAKNDKICIPRSITENLPHTLIHLHKNNREILQNDLENTKKINKKLKEGDERTEEEYLNEEERNKNENVINNFNAVDEEARNENSRIDENYYADNENVNLNEQNCDVRLGEEEFAAGEEEEEEEINKERGNDLRIFSETMEENINNNNNNNNHVAKYIKSADGERKVTPFGEQNLYANDREEEEENEVCKMNHKSAGGNSEGRREDERKEINVYTLNTNVILDELSECTNSQVNHIQKINEEKEEEEEEKEEKEKNEIDEEEKEEISGNLMTLASVEIPTDIADNEENKNEQNDNNASPPLAT